jgi:hypothetical protein
MAKVRKAVAEDFEKIFPLFVKFENPRLSKEAWRQLFVDHWHCNEGYFGYVLEDEGLIVGFLGLIFSRRILNGKEAKFCNITSWVVEKKFRNQSLSLFLPVMKLKDYILTIHTASKETYSVARKLGFQDLESNLRIVFPLPSFSTWLTFCEVEINGKNLNETLTGEALQLYKDHLPFKCFHVRICTSLGECFLIGTRIYRKKIAFSQIHHISHSKVFSEFAGRITLAICLQIKTVATIIDERFLQGKTVSLSTAWPLPYPRVYKPDSFGQNDIDSLYSELPMLNL